MEKRAAGQDEGSTEKSEPDWSFFQNKHISLPIARLDQQTGSTKRILEEE